MASWNETEALSWFAQKHGMTVFTGVPLTRPNWKGWGAECLERRGMVAVPSGSNGVVRWFDEAAFIEALAGSAPVHPILGRGAGRYAYGHLITQQAFLERSWQPVAPVQPVTVVEPGDDHPNTASAFNAAGITITAIDGEAPPRRRGGSGWPAKNDPWGAPKGEEAKLLHELWTRRGRAGWWLAEVPVGEGAPRRFDAVAVAAVDHPPSPGSSDLDEFRVAVADGKDVELIEAKKELNEQVVGQLLAGAPMFSEEYPGHGELSLTACVKNPGDEAIEWFRERSEILLEVVS